MSVSVEAFFDKNTSTLSYLVVEPNGRHCALIDTVLDFDQASGRTGTGSADAMIEQVRERGLTVDWLLETHAHADHLSGARYIKAKLGGKIAIGARISAVQTIFKEVFNLEKSFNTDGRQFDHVFEDGETFLIGRQPARVIYTPGHTPACATYVIDDCAFVGDTLFMPDGGTARCDFPGGDASLLYQSIHKILALPDDTKLYICHDYQPGGRELAYQTTVAEQKQRNIHVGGDTSEAAFVERRTSRDATLSTPTLLIPSIQVNVRAGELPPPEDNGTRYLKVPINRL